MAQRLTVDEDALKNVATRLIDASGLLDTARGALETRLSEQGQCWGTSDQVARTFTKDYVHGRDQVIEGSKNLAQLLLGLGTVINDLTKQFSSTEHDNT